MDTLLALRLALVLAVALKHLLLEHDAVHAGFEQGRHEARFALQDAQRIENCRSWPRRKVGEQRRKLCGMSVQVIASGRDCVSLDLGFRGA